MKTHFSDCPTTKNYDFCACDMCGEERAVVFWQINRQEGKEKWWHIIPKLTLCFFGCGPIDKIENEKSLSSKESNS